MVSGCHDKAPVNSRDKTRACRPPAIAPRYGIELARQPPNHHAVSASFLDDLRARLPVSEVVGRRVQLKKAGREWKGLSPFNKEKTPSFFVNDQKAAWFDFSSGKNGNIFDFVMQTEGVNVPGSGGAARLDGGHAAAESRRRKPRRARSGARRCTT